MITRLFKIAVLVLMLLGCASPESEMGGEHNALPEKQSESTPNRGFDPCKLNNTLPVCG